MIDAKTHDLITRFECGAHAGRDSYPEWPGGDSGITIGIGYDLGYVDAFRFRQDWGSVLPEAIVTKLAGAVGLKGEAADRAEHAYRDIDITWRSALRVFDERTLPRVEQETRGAFPGCDRLPQRSYGALVSLVYNRGPSVTGGMRRAGMRRIRGLIAADGWDMVPVELADMAALWPDPAGPTASNLQGRRYAEGHLFEDGLRGAAIVQAETLLLGDTGSRVAALQRALKITPDGQFGPATLRAVIAWQTLQGVPTHGIADPVVLRGLGVA